MSDHNSLSSHVPVASAVSRSARTNDPLAPKKQGLPRGWGWSAEARRYRDLAAHYSTLIGAKRLKDEATVAAVRQLIWTSIEIEEMQDRRLRGEVIKTHTLLHLSQHQLELLKMLGLTDATRSDAQPELRDYLKEPAP